LIVSPQRIAEDAANMLIKVLDGQSASSIPIMPGQPPQPIFDGGALRRWNISTASLPPGSDIRFLEPSIWQLHPVQVAVISFAILAQAVLITWLLFEHRRRRIAEVTARSAMAELAHMDRVATAGVLSASIAHEINQPLMGIVASASAALNWLSGTVPDLDRARSALKKIVDAGHHAGDIVQNIRAMVRKETGSLGSFDINRVIQDVLVLLQIDLRENEIAWQLRLEGTLPVTGNRVQIQQVLLNLIANAIDSMSSVKERPHLLRVASRTSKPGEVLVSIEDNGPGVPADDLQHIFEPMFTTKSQGMGMGLAICQSIIEAHHGRFGRRRESREGRYSSSRCHQAEQAMTEEDRLETAPIVFIVDDDQDVRDGLKDLVESVGLRAITFTSTMEFLRYELPDVPSCLVLDVRLPGISGLDFQTELTAAQIGIPIIFITGHGDIPMSVKAMKAGAVEFLTKPIREQDLLDAVRVAIENDLTRRTDERRTQDLRHRYDALTTREKEIMALVTAGLMNKQTAAEIGLSEVTVKVHRHNLMKKLGAHSLAELVRIADLLDVSHMKRVH
jgi:FixJ family two-component response regulator/signal transduction histidine kinase